MLVGSLFTWLNGQFWFTTGANVWQWVTSLVAICGWSFAAWVFWHHRCNVCRIRPAHHPVKGTTYRVCDRHHLVAHHHALRTRHQERHPDRLGFGESPGSGRSGASRSARARA